MLDEEYKLPDLIRLRFSLGGLETEDFGDFRMDEDVMTSRYACTLEPELFYESDEIVKPDVCDGPVR
jgi:hypothetical protein